MFYHQPEEGLESLLPDIRKLSIEANDLPRLVPGREVHTLNVWRLGSISNFSLTHNSVSGTVRGTAEVIAQLLNLEVFTNNVTELASSMMYIFRPSIDEIFHIRLSFGDRTMFEGVISISFCYL
jgi:hypothetical protein